MAEKKTDEYPKMLYRAADQGHAHESAPGADDHIVCQHRVVESETEEAEAKADGWANSPAELVEAPAKKGAK